MLGRGAATGTAPPFTRHRDRSWKPNRTNLRPSGRAPFARPKGAEKGGCHRSGRRDDCPTMLAVDGRVGNSPAARRARQGCRSRCSRARTARLQRPPTARSTGNPPPDRRRATRSGAVSFRRFSLGEQRKSARPAGRKLPQHAADLQQGYDLGQTAQTEPDASSRPSTSNGAPPPT